MLRTLSSQACILCKLCEPLSFLAKLCEIVFCNSLFKFLCTFVLQIIFAIQTSENEKLKQHA